MKDLKVGWTFLGTIFLICLGMLLGIWVYKSLWETDSPRLRRYDLKEPSGIRNTQIPSDKIHSSNAMKRDEKTIDVAGYEEVLDANTIYRIVENDILRNHLEEREEKLPEMFVGMNRKQFLNAMKEYSVAVPLEEREKGFVGLEVESFSPGKVVVRKDYRYVDPKATFYVAVLGDEVVALMEDKTTVYINTGIRLDTLPDHIRLQVMQMIRMENVEELYSFLEAYTS